MLRESKDPCSRAYKKKERKIEQDYIFQSQSKLRVVTPALVRSIKIFYHLHGHLE